MEIISVGVIYEYTYIPYLFMFGILCLNYQQLTFYQSTFNQGVSMYLTKGENHYNTLMMLGILSIASKSLISASALRKFPSCTL